MQDKKAICGILLCVNVCVLTLLLVFRGINMLNFGENLALNSQNSTQNSALNSQTLNSATQNSNLILQNSSQDLNFSENSALTLQNSNKDLNFTQNSALNSQTLNLTSQNSNLISQNSAQDLNLSENSAENSAFALQNSKSTSPNSNKDFNLSQNSALNSQTLNSATQNSAHSPTLPLLASVLSFEFAFFISLCIIVLSFLSYKKSILSESKALKPPKIRPAILAQKPPNKNAKIQNFRPANNEFRLKFTHKLTAFFSLAKLVSYALLAVGFLALNAHALLDIAGFICGVSSVLAGCFFYGLWLNHKEKSQNSRQKGC